MNLSKSRKLKVNVMRALQQNEDSAVKQGILGALIEDELTEEELEAPREVADATRQVVQAIAAPALPAPDAAQASPDAPSEAPAPTEGEAEPSGPAVVGEPAGPKE